MTESVVGVFAKRAARVGETPHKKERLPTPPSVMLCLEPSAHTVSIRQQSHRSQAQGLG
ncbi:UNVERIFIED_ORG: hypothetical protein GGD48_005898 [Rhizobium etli]